MRCFEARGLQHLALLLEDSSQALAPARLDVLDGACELVRGGDEVLGRVDVDRVQLGQHLAGQRVDLDDALDLVAQELDAHGQLLVGGHDLEGVAAHAELAAR